MKSELKHDYLFPQISNLNRNDDNPGERAELMASLADYGIDGLEQLIKTIDEEKVVCNDQLVKMKIEQHTLNILEDNTKWYVELAGAIKQIALVKIEQLKEV